MINLAKVTAFAALCVGAVVLTGCASMFGDNSRQVTVKSEPVGAQVFVNGMSVGSTPAIVTLPTYIYGSQLITLRKPGYQDISINVNSKFQMVGLWNLLNGWGFIIDAADGNLVKIDPAQLNVETNLSKA